MSPDNVSPDDLERMRQIVLAAVGPGPDVDVIARLLLDAPPFTGEFGAVISELVSS